MTKKRIRSPVHADSSAGALDPQPAKLSNDDMGRILEIVATNPDDVIRKIAKAEGFPYHATEKFLKRLRVTHANFKDTVKKLGRRELVETLDEKIALGLHYMDDFSLSGMDGKDLAIMIGILIEKKQLMEGRPTQILSFEERGHLADLLPAYAREAKRRGIMIDETAVEVADSMPRPVLAGDFMTDIVPRTFAPDETREETLSHTARSRVVKQQPIEDR